MNAYTPRSSTITAFALALGMGLTYFALSASVGTLWSHALIVPSDSILAQ